MVDVVIPVADQVEQIRFAEDRRMMSDLLADEKVAKVAEQSQQGGGDASYKRHLLATGLRVTERILPGMIKLVGQAREIMHLGDRTVETYVYSDQRMNASCTYFGGSTIYVCASSGLVERMTDPELMFVIGHELGHAVYEHHLLPTYGLMSGQSNVPADVALKLMSWSRRAEISADRAGVLCCQDTNAAMTALIKLSCGLTEPKIQFNPVDYAAQMQDIQSLSSSKMDTQDCYSTHPFNPLRVVALSSFGESEMLATALNRAGDGISADEMDGRINELLELMEPVSENEQEKEEQAFLLWGGMLVALADGKIENVESRSIVEMCGEEAFEGARQQMWMSDEGSAFVRAKLKDAAVPLAGRTQADQCALVQKLIVVARADQVIEDSEKDVLREVCELLGIDPTFVEQVLMFLG